MVDGAQAAQVQARLGLELRCAEDGRGAPRDTPPARLPTVPTNLQ